MKFLASRSAKDAKGPPPREFLSASFTLTPARLKTLGANPLEMVPAPGVGAIIIPNLLIATGEGGVGYDSSGGNLIICCGGDRLLPVFPQMPNVVGYAAPFEVMYGPGENRDLKSNAGLVMTTDIEGGELADGDYAITFRIEYEIIRL